jgi:two-component system, OmpR family, response regulator
MQLRILLVEDDEQIASFVAKGLTQAGNAVSHVTSAEDALGRAAPDVFDLFIVDIMLPGMDGLSLIEKLRSRKIKAPVIILSAKRSVDDRVRGLTMGGDDYLTKPFAFSELTARIQAVMRRATGTQDAVRMAVGDLELDLLTRKVARGGRSIELQPKEFALLSYLMRNVGRVVSKTQIMEHVWDYDFDPQTNVVEARMSRLRDKIDAGEGRPLIHTIRGVGYVLREEP